MTHAAEILAALYVASQRLMQAHDDAKACGAHDLVAKIREANQKVVDSIGVLVKTCAAEQRVTS